MPTYQTNNNIMVAIQRELAATPGVPAVSTPGSSLGMRVVESTGLELTRSEIQSNEKRADGLKPMMRLGSKTDDGGYNFEVTVGGATDLAFESIMRSVWRAAVPITQASAGPAGTLTIASAGGNLFTLTRQAGSWITDLVRVHDVTTLTGYTPAGNNNIRLRVTAVTALVLTVAAPPNSGFVAAAASANWTLTILKKLVNPAVPVRYSHSVEENNSLADISDLHVGARLVGMSFSFKPNSMATYTLTFKALDALRLVPGTSPYFTTPVFTTGLALIADDSVIRYMGADVAHFTGLDLNFEIDAEGVATIGSLTAPDIADGDLKLTGSATMLMSDYVNVTAYDAETEFTMSILLTEPNAVPKPCIGINLLRVKISKRSAPLGGGGGFKVETVNLAVGPKVATATEDAGYATIFSSAP